MGLALGRSSSSPHARLKNSITGALIIISSPLLMYMCPFSVLLIFNLWSVWIEGEKLFLSFNWRLVLLECMCLCLHMRDNLDEKRRCIKMKMIFQGHSFSSNIYCSNLQLMCTQWIKSHGMLNCMLPSGHTMVDLDGEPLSSQLNSPWPCFYF